MNIEELEKEAGKYADKHAFRVPYDGSNKFYDDVDFKASKEAYLAGAKPREKRIAELEAIARNTKAVDESFALQTIQLSKAKELIQNLIRVTWGEGWSYSLDWKVKAEQFLNSELQSKWINPARTTNDNEIKLNSKVEK